MKPTTSIQISIPNPCHEDWDKMTPQQQGRFCDSCQKCVVDFTGFTDEQLYKFFQKHKGENICGRFSTLQVLKNTYTPKRTLKQIHKWFISLGIVIFLTDLFSPDATAQGSSGNIVGYISDTNGNGIANTLVKILDHEVVKDSTFSDNDGAYVIKKLNPGKYTVLLHSPGFRKQVISEVIISPDKSTEIKNILQLCLDSDSKTDSNVYVARLTSTSMGGVNVIYIPDETEIMSGRNAGKKRSFFFTRFWRKIF